jgi:DNA ligase-1
VKTFHDEEAKVIGYEPGKGNFTGMVGALKCKNKAGAVFGCGSGLTIKDRKRPPKVGSFITYKFQGLSKEGNPRFPIYLRPYVEV